MPIRLTAEQTAQLKGQEGALKELLADIAAAKRAGLDVGELEEVAKSLEMKRAGMLAEFAPGAVRRATR